jgi:diguanylate cyclase (GGDEF)-like protein
MPVKNLSRWRDRVRQWLADDGLLLSGFVVAVIVALVRPFEAAYALARDVEAHYRLALLPALFVLLVTFVLHQQRKREAVAAHAAATAAEAEAARERARDLEGLVVFGRALSGALDVYALRAELQARLRGVVGGPASVVLRVAGGWHTLAGTGEDAPHAGVIEQVASRAMDLAGAEGGAGPATAIRVDDVECFPLMTGGDTVGMLVVDGGPAPLSDARRGRIAAAGAVVAIAARNAALVQDIRDHGLRDALTGCFNRAHALERIELELQRSARSGAPVSVILFDLDHFKSVNDRHGHLAGDAVLAAVGDLMRRVLRTSDLKCRYGGEEFLVLLADTHGAPARAVASSLRRAIAQAAVTFDGASLVVTASFGVATAAEGEVDPSSLVARADRALYAAKRAGRNCVVLAADPAPDAPRPAPQSRRSPHQMRLPGTM